MGRDLGIENGTTLSLIILIPTHTVTLILIVLYIRRLNCPIIACRSPLLALSMAIAPVFPFTTILLQFFHPSFPCLVNMASEFLGCAVGVFVALLRIMDAFCEWMTNQMDLTLIFHYGNQHQHVDQGNEEYDESGSGKNGSRAGNKGLWSRRITKGQSGKALAPGERLSWFEKRMVAFLKVFQQPFFPLVRKSGETRPRSGGMIKPLAPNRRNHDGNNRTSSILSNNADCLTTAQCPTNAMRGGRIGRRERLVYALSIPTLISGIAFVITATFSPAGYLNNPGQPTCLMTDWIFVYLVSGLYLILTPLVLVTLKNVQDNLGLRSEVSTAVVAGAVGFMGHMVASAVPELPIYLHRDVWTIIPLVFMSWWTLAYPLYLEQRFRSLRDLILRTRSKQSLKKLLDTRVLYHSFQRTLAADLCIENGLFYQELQRLKRYQPNACEDQEHRQRASPPPRLLSHTISGMIARYFHRGSPYELNIDARCRERVLARYARGERSWHMFEEAGQQVFLSMYYNSYPKWCVSQRASGAGKA